MKDKNFSDEEKYSQEFNLGHSFMKKFAGVGGCAIVI